MTDRAALLRSTSTLAPHVLVPSDFGDDPISRMYRGIMFGWDDDREKPFQGLTPRAGPDDGKLRVLARWKAIGTRDDRRF